MMKKISAAILVLVMLGIMLSSVGCGNKEVVFGVISDVHLIVSQRDNDAQRQENLRKALTYYKENDVDLIAVNGDIVDCGQEEAYKTFNRIFEEVFPNKKTAPKLLVTADNHEYWDGGTAISPTPSSLEELKQRFLTAFDLESSNNSIRVGGYQFIGVSSDGSNGSNYATYSEETITWLEKELEKANKKSGKKPIFVFVHQPPMNTVDSSGASCVSTLNGVFEEYPQNVVFSSHIHTPLQDERSIHQEYFTTVNTASLFYAIASDGMIYANGDEPGCLPKRREFAQGLLVRVSGTKVDIERRDFYSDVTIKENWVIEEPSNIDSYVYTEARKDAQEPLTFAEGAKGSVVKKNTTNYEVTFDAAVQKDRVHYYKVCAMRPNSEFPARTLNIVSDYYREMEKETEWVCLFEDLKKDVDYTFKIYAVDCFGNESEPLVIQ